MDPMVSARVPAELRDQANERLKAMGATPTELINRAYREFVSTGELPGGSDMLQPGHRTLDESERGKLAASIAATSSPVPESYFADKSYDELLEGELAHAYSSLA